MVHKMKTGLTEGQMQALEDINDLDRQLKELDDAIITLDEQSLYGESEEAQEKFDEVKKEQKKLIHRAFGSYKNYSKAQVKYGKRFR